MAGLLTRRSSRKRSLAALRPQLERLEGRTLLHGAPDFIHDNWPAFFGGAPHVPEETNVIQLDSAPTNAPRMTTPLAGTPNQDWAIGHYVDLDTAYTQYPPSTEFGNYGFPYLNQTRDYRGRTDFDAYTYDQHGGIDITLPNFAAQDVGLPVYAAADGTVYEVHDGEFDRQYNGDGDNVTNNVIINHGNDWYTNYVHLRKDSVAVVVGQSVRKGQVVGLVGSSGTSLGAHLHFETYKCVHDIPGNPGGCRFKSVETYQHESTFWDTPLPYAGDVYGALDSGMTGDDPGIASPRPWYELLSRPVEQKVFNRPSTVWFWVNLHGIEPNPGDQFRFRWYSPDGNEVFPPHGSYPAAEIHFGWQWDRLDIGPTSPRGQWRVEFIYRNQVLAEDRFLITDNPDLLQGDVGFDAGDYHITEKGVSDYGGAVRLKIWRTSPIESVSVSYSTSDAGAQAGSDYVAKSGTVRFNQGDLVKTIDIPLIDDPCPEHEESFYVTLSNPTDQASLMFPSSAKVHIHDSADSPFRLDANTKELLVEGCGGNDEIDVTVARTASSNYVTVNVTRQPDTPGAGPTETYQRSFALEDEDGQSLIDSIVIRGGGGNDTIDVDAVANTVLGLPVRVEGGDGNDGITVRAPNSYSVFASLYDLTLLGGEGDDTIEIVSGNAGGIFGSFNLDGENGYDRLIANDLRIGLNADILNYTLQSGWIDRGNYGRLPFAGVEEVTLNAGNVRDIFNIESTTPDVVTTINAGYGRDEINVRGTSATGQTHVHGGGDADHITVVAGSVVGPRTTIYGDEEDDEIEVMWGVDGFFFYSHGPNGLTVNGDAGSDKLVMNDTASPRSDQYAVSSNTASARSPNEFFPSVVTYQTIEEVVVKSGGAGSTFNINDSQSGTHIVIEAGSGNDFVQLGAGNLDPLRGRVTIKGEAGIDNVTLADDGNNFNDTYTLTNNTISRPLFAGDAADGLTYETIENLTLNAQHGNNTFQINSTVAAPISINGGMGNDTFRFANGGGVAGRIDGQDGTDTLDYLAYRTAAEVNRVAGTATGIGGGFASIENVRGAAIASAFDVLDRKLATGLLNGMFEAETLLGYPSGDSRIASETFAGLGVIDFIDPENAGSLGHFAVNNPFPNNTAGDNDDFAVKITAVVQFPSSGFWTFGTHSDDGVRLRIDGSIIIDDPLPHAPEDRFAIYFATAGYHTLELAFFERGGGATLELFSAPGFHSSFNPNFRLVGDVANGGLNVFATTGFSVRDVKKTVPAVNNLTDADALLALRPGDPGIASERSAILPTIDFFDTEGGGGTGHYNLNRPFPNDTPSADDHFATRADAFIYIPANSDWTFATNSDDGVRLKIDGNTVLDEPLPQGPTDHLRVVSLTRGFHALNLTYFEQGGGAELELFAAQHINTAFSSNFRLVGDTANGGLLALAASNCLTVTNTLDGGPGSLRDAIGCANILPGHDTINFAIPGAGVHTVRPTSPLPAIADVTTIDGYSQPGARPNSIYGGTDAVLRVELDGTSAGPDTNGLTVAASDSAVRGLVINRFTQHGIEVAYRNRNVVQGNYIGTDTTGSLDLGNGGNGIQITAPATLRAEQNTIGGLFPADRNVVSGNAGDGVVVSGNGATGNFIQGNFIGTDATGSMAVGNSGDGIELGFAYGTVVGAGLLGGRNIISGNAGDGIRINGGSGPLAQPVSRWRGDGNPFDSVGFNGGTLLGGMTYAPGQFNQAFNLDGVDDLVEIPDSPSHTTSALTLEAWVRPDTLGTHHSIASKYDSRFSEGISWSLQMTPDGKVEFVVVQSYIANGPIVLRGIRTVEAVLTPGTWRHVVATFDVATQRMEIYIDGALIAATLLPGSQSLASIADSPTPMRLGAIFASGGFVGLTQFWDGLLDEVALYDRALSASEVQALYRRNVGAHSITANFIGTDATGTAPLGNAGDGISIANSTGNMIGGMLPLFSNTIAHNGGVGVVVESGAGNAVLTNSIYSNAVLGIDLTGNMVTPNDPMDADGGANGLQNFPEVHSAVVKPNRLDVSGVMRSRASQPYTLQFFASATCDPSGHGQGATMVGSVDVNTSAAGSVNYVAMLPRFGPVAPFITATATDAVGNTSEFAACRTVVPEVPGDVNADGTVNLLDIVIQQGRLGQATTAGVFGGDLDGDGLVSRSDVARLIQSYGASAPSPRPAAAPGAVVRHLNNAATDAAIASMTDRESRSQAGAWERAGVLRSRRHSRPVLNARAPEAGLATARTVSRRV